MTTLSWDDLLLQNLLNEDTKRCLDCWDNIGSETVHLLAASRFGDFFLLNRNGSVNRLDIIFGAWETIFNTHDEFIAAVNSQAWQEHNLFSMQILSAHSAGLIPGNRQVYAMVPHPRVNGGQLTFEGMQIMDITVAHHIYSQIIKQCGGINVA